MTGAKEPEQASTRIAAIGTGALGKLWSAAGHTISYGSRDPASGHDAEAKAEVAALAETAMLWGRVAFPLGLGPDIALRLLRR
jgi:hypothetical protein